MPSWRVVLLLVVSLMLPTVSPAAEDARLLKWDDLVPSDWNAEDMLKTFDLENLSDDDPRAQKLLDDLRASWDAAPLVETLNGTRVKIPGYVVVLDADRNGVSEFLLVPYFGACIHVPPPPANQLIHVIPQRKLPGMVAMLPVWVTGVIETRRAETEYGIAGYHITATDIEEYEERQ